MLIYKIIFVFLATLLLTGCEYKTSDELIASCQTDNKGSTEPCVVERCIMQVSEGYTYHEGATASYWQCEALNAQAKLFACSIKEAYCK